MINIDKTDQLYKYLTALKVKDVDKVYMELAQNGRYNRDDVRQYFREIFEPSKTEDIDEKELEKVLDYYVDLKTIKPMNSKELKLALKEFKQTNDKNLKIQIINSQLKDILYLCLNYKSMHKDVDVQDLLQVASLGLIDALEAYDDNAKLDFKDYIVYWIREKIIKEFEEKQND